MKKRLLSLLMAFAMMVSLLPATVLAGEKDTVSLSASYDGKYLTGLAGASVALSDLAKIDLVSYGLGDFAYDADSDGTNEITVLHLIIYAHTVCLGKNWDDVTVSGGPGSIFFERGLFGYTDCNMNYYVNGVYPAVDGWGVTADQYVLSAGDFVDFAAYSSWSFYSDSAAGFHYFMAGSEITHAYTVKAGEPLSIGLGRTGGGMGSETSLNAEPGYPVYYGLTLYETNASSATTNSSGEASITFDTAGTYYLWVDGAYGNEDPQNVVSSPAYAVVTVEADEPESVTYPVTVTAPAGSTVSVGTMSNYFIYTFTEPLNVTESGDTVTYGFPVPTSSGNSFVRVQNPEGVTYWDYTALTDGRTIEITEEMLFMDDSKHNSDTIIRDFSEYEMDVADVYINANAQGYLPMDVNDTFEFNVFRNWHAVEGISNAKTALPDVSYQVIDIDGNSSDVVTIVPDENNSSVAAMTAKEEGTAIVLVTYDAMYSTLALRGSIGTDTAAPAFFSAIWPENTGVLVVTVGADGSDVQTNMTLNNHDLDAEHDVLYYVGNDGASYTFTPEEGSTVSVARATLTESSLTYSGFEPVAADENGSFTVSGLTAGSHIVKVEKNGLSTYQVVCAKQTTVTVTGADGEPINEENPAEPGETVTIQLGNLYNPVNKLSGIYNSNCAVTYMGEDGATATGNRGSGFGYYLFASDPEVHKVSFTLPEVWARETYTLNGYLAIGGNGSGAGAHRDLTYAAGKEEQTNAGATSAQLGRLPELVIPVNASARIPAETVELNKTTLALGIGGSGLLTAAVLPEDSTDTLLWTSANPAVAAVDKNGVVTGVAAGETIITVTAGEVSATCTVKVTAETAEDIVLLTESSEELYMGDMVLVEIAISGAKLAGEVTTDGYRGLVHEAATVPLAAGDYETLTVAMKAGASMAVQNIGAQLRFYCNDVTSPNTLNLYPDYVYTTSVSPVWEDNRATLVMGVSRNGSVQSTYTITLTREEQAAAPVTYTITLPAGEGYTAEAAEGSASPVTEGGSYSFTVTVAEGYEAGENFAVKANDVELTAVEGVYTIENIIADQTITVTGVAELPAEPTPTWQEVMALTRAYLTNQVDSVAVGSTKGEWLVLGLARDGAQSALFDGYLAAAKAYVAENIDANGCLHAQKSTDNARLILALTAIGKDTTNIAGHDLLKGLSDLNYVKNQGINGPIFALIALDSHEYPTTENASATREALIDCILEKELSGGGWALSGTDPDDMTPMAVQALAPYYSTNAAVKTAVDKALTVMDAMVETASPETCAQIIVARSALQLDSTAAMTRMLTFALEDGSFEKSTGSGANQMSTEQAFYAMVAYDRYLSGKNALYDMTDVTIEEAQPSSAESVKAAMEALTVEQPDKATYTAIQNILEAYASLTREEKAAIADTYEDFLEKEEDFEDLLDDAIDDAKLDLEDLYEDLDSDEYTEDNWDEIRALYRDIRDQMKKARYTEELEALLETFEEEVDNILVGAMEVTFRLIGDFKHDGGVSDHDEYVTWIKTTEYTLPAESTVYDLLIMALDEYNISQKGASKNYVESIQAPEIFGGYWLGEFDNGSNSGWMYTINGDHPGTGLKDHELEDGDQVIWHYVDDYTLEQRKPSSKYYERWLEADDITPETYIKRNLDNIVTIEGKGEVKPELKASHIGKDVKFTFTPAEGWAIKTVYVDGKNKGAVETYTYKKLAMDARIEVIFEQTTETEVSLTFTDVQFGDWFYEDVQFAVQSGLFNGVSENAFSPNASMTRAMLVTVLYRLEGQPTVTGSSSFSDVAAGQWYSDAVIWAARMGIVNGLGDGKFGANDPVTREQMAAILYRYAAVCGYDTTARANLNGYADAAKISAYAQDAMSWANAVGLINGRTAAALAPTGTATRAEVAAIFHRFVENIAK